MELHIVLDIIHVYHTLVIIFYNNAQRTSSRIFTFVKGIEIDLTTYQLNSISQMPSIIELKSINSLTEMLNAIVHNIKSFHLSLPSSLMYFIISHLLLEKSGAPDNISKNLHPSLYFRRFFMSTFISYS